MGRAFGIILLASAIAIASLQPIRGTRGGKFSGFFGCKYSDVCTEDEECIDDGLFGNCQNILAAKDRFQYDLDLDTVITLQRALQRLIREDFSWDSVYTQCVLGDVLLAFRVDAKPDLGFCDAGIGEGGAGDDSSEETDEDAKKEASLLLQRIIEDYRTKNPAGSEESEEAETNYADPDAFEKKDSNFVDIHKYFKAAERRGSNPLYGYPSPDGSAQEIFQLGPQMRNYDNLKPMNDRRISQPSVANPWDDEPLYESVGTRGDSNDDDNVDAFLSKLDLKELEELNTYLQAMKQEVLEENPQGLDKYVSPPYKYVEATKPSSLSDLLEDQNNRDPEEEEALEIAEIIEKDKEGDLEKAEDDNLMTPEDAKLLGDLLDGQARPQDLSNEDIERMTRHVMSMLQKLDEKDGLPDQSPPTADDENLAIEKDAVDIGSMPANLNKELMNSELLNSDNNKQSNKDNDDDDDPSQDIPVGIDAEEEIEEMAEDDGKGHEVAAAAKSPEDDIYIDGNHVYITIDREFRSNDEGRRLVASLQYMLHLASGTFTDARIEGNTVTFRVNPNSLNVNGSVVAARAEKDDVKSGLLQGVTVVDAGIGDGKKLKVPVDGTTPKYFVLTFVLCGCIAGILLAVIAIYLIKRHTRSKAKLAKLAATGAGGEASKDYEDLCRQRMQTKASEKPEPLQIAGRVSSVASEGAPGSSSSRSSTSSWSEEPVTSNMDITTGHIILSYMEDHLKNKDRLDQEWEELYTYVPEPNGSEIGGSSQNARKNRYSDILPYDHSRVVLNKTANVLGSDYINANTITDHDPRNPAYIATQGPLPHTVADFWQMIWEQGSVVIVMLSKPTENGVTMCHRYWPEEGSDLYHIYEVHLVSEHIWCDDYLVRSFYLKNLQTNETRTVTQFHFLTWPDLGVPASAKALLDFRRKVNKSYRGRSCPIVVHCSDGVGRTGTYCLIDMVLNRMSKGAKEIDIAATLEHIRDQRMGMVKTKEQFQFVLAAVAEEVHAILKALPQ
ncbi:receptor-type tyrosine-protein phosphatase N2-like isoform X2 [Lineus longissimus]|uniref:receptor-type tyrosine-protein phosphatase N2-like isoform X2 n=1 Tax=Lineus longissimus TaxID=88925 RepID=UPI002B4F0E5F